MAASTAWNPWPFLDHTAKLIGGGGSCFPSIVVVALGEPGTPVICWAETGVEPNSPVAIAEAGPSELQKSFGTECSFGVVLFLQMGSKGLATNYVYSPRSRRLPVKITGSCRIQTSVGDRRRYLWMNMRRICGSLAKIYGFLFLCDFGCPLLPQLLHEDLIWMVLFAALSSSGYWARLRWRTAVPGARAELVRRLVLTFPLFGLSNISSAIRCNFDLIFDMSYLRLISVRSESSSVEHPRYLTGGDSASADGLGLLDKGLSA